MAVFLIVMIAALVGADQAVKYWAEMVSDRVHLNSAHRLRGSARQGIQALETA